MWHSPGAVNVSRSSTQPGAASWCYQGLSVVCINRLCREGGTLVAGDYPTLGRMCEIPGVSLPQRKVRNTTEPLPVGNNMQDMFTLLPFNERKKLVSLASWVWKKFCRFGKKLNKLEEIYSHKTRVWGLRLIIIIQSHDNTQNLRF